MQKPARSYLIAAAIVAFVVVTGLASYIYRRMSIQAAFKSVQVGDSRGKVVALIGRPGATGPCGGQAPCTSLYYHSLFEEWVILVDSNDQVIGKVKHEGSF